ncbi:hypothetical protein G210_0647 [Candida maltosa Xu316]|uniref:Uncharacterized protein n=1 Tax=Candida maltosa (strain Xu316) TaxID=1245528 RepID=M3IQJ2_CANMX|nr:hypothetical protein G210_0647 [Candida maltosa Xu316]
MKFSSLSLTAILSSTLVSAAADQSQVDFLTAFVGDFQDHKTEYVKYFATAQGIPPELSTLATQVLTYTDQSYTTLLDNDNLDVNNLISYASGIPWYTRIQAEIANGSGSPSGSASETAGASASANGNSVTSATSKATSAASSVASSATSTGSSTSHAGSANIIAPVGAIVGALAVALM